MRYNFGQRQHTSLKQVNIEGMKSKQTVPSMMLSATGGAGAEGRTDGDDEVGAGEVVPSVGVGELASTESVGEVTSSVGVEGVVCTVDVGVPVVALSVLVGKFVPSVG